MTRLLAAIVCLLLAVSPVNAQTYPGQTKLTSAGGAVQAGPYNTIQAGAANFGPSTGQTSLEFVTVGQRYRIRQAGTITQFKIQLPSTASITGLYLKIWRAQYTAFGASTVAYDLVGVSNNVVGSIAAGANTLTLSTPITGVQPGDYIGARVEYSSASVQNLRSTVVPNTSADNVPTIVYSVLNATPATFQYNWAGQTALSGSAVIEEVSMAAPVFMAIGDSITSGLEAQTSFDDNDRNTVQLYTAYPSVLGSLLGYTYQNAGIGGDTVAGVNGRFPTDVIAKNPKFVVIMVGVNDLLAGSTAASLVPGFTIMLNAASAANITPIIIGVLPFRTYSVATNAMLQQRDLLNASLKALVTAAPYNGIYVSPDPMGVNYAGGDPNNLWSQGYAPVDGLHPAPEGYAVLARMVYDALQNASTRVLSGQNAETALNASLGNTALGLGASALDTSGYHNTAVGTQALYYNTSGFSNTAFGNNAARTTGLSGSGANSNTAVGASSLFANISGSNNDAFGLNALNANTASFNGAFGSGALTNNTTGIRNVGIGYNTLFVNTTGLQNTAVGFSSLFSNLTGTDNTAVGQAALFSNTASFITAIGSGALNANTSGTRNTAVGYQSLAVNNTGANNTAIGFQAGNGNTTGTNNTSMGVAALFVNTTGVDNTAVGFNALFTNNGSNNNAFGNGALVNNTSGSSNVADGFNSLAANTTGNSHVAVGANALQSTVADAGNTGIGTNALADVNGGSFNTVLGDNSGRGITTGSNNTIVGAQVTGLGAALSGAIILADGAGNIRYDYGKTTAGGHTFAGGLVSIPTSTPASASAACAAGVVTWDASFIYVCIAANTWKRVAIATW